MSTNKLLNNVTVYVHWLGHLYEDEHNVLFEISWLRKEFYLSSMEFGFGQHQLCSPPCGLGDIASQVCKTWCWPQHKSKITRILLTNTATLAVLESRSMCFIQRRDAYIVACFRWISTDSLFTDVTHRQNVLTPDKINCHPHLKM